MITKIEPYFYKDILENIKRMKNYLEENNIGGQ